MTMRSVQAVASALILATACGAADIATAPAPTACADVIPGCDVDRLPNVILTGDAHDGALSGVDAADLSGIISFDQALRAAGREDFQGPADSVRVVLGTADPGAMHWGASSGIYYAVEWDGVCMAGSGGFVPGSTQTTSSCEPRRWGTVIDARDGRFIVSGT